MSKRKNVLYYSIGNGYFADVIENTISGKIDLFIYSSEYPEFKVQYPGPDGTLRQNFKTLESYIKSNAVNMVKEYHKEPYIRNRCDLELPVILDEKTFVLKKMFHNIYFSETEDGYSVEVEEIQKFQDGTMIRNYFICDNTQTYKYRVLSSEGDMAGFTPMDELIPKEIKGWIKEQADNVIDVICKELEGIKYFVDETDISGYCIKMFEYIGGGFCVHTYDGDTDMFYKYREISDAYMDFYKKAKEQLDKISIKNTEVHIRKRINSCRKHLAENNAMMFISEMSIIKGLLYSCNKNEVAIGKIVPEEKHISSFVKKYEEITKDTFSDFSL